MIPLPPGSEKREVALKNRMPPNIIPNTAVVRELTITGETGMLVLEVHVKIITVSQMAYFCTSGSQTFQLETPKRNLTSTQDPN